MASPAYEQIGKDIELYIGVSGNNATRMSRINKIFQPTLIILAVLASARLFPTLANAGAWLSIVVAIATSCDKWLKPEATFKAHYRYNDHFIAFRQDWTLTPDEPAAIKNLSDRFKKLVDDYTASVL
ncbi:MAG TPA: hypothetical protein VGF61_13095 [Candidatus Acidoferrum sp.]|jgi:hypothetical protein